MIYPFTIHGKMKPYVRMTQKSKFYGQAAEYLASQDAVRVQLRQQMTANAWEMLPGQTPLSVSIVIYHKGGLHGRDCDNEMKAILDAMSGIVYPDDRWIDVLRAERVKDVDDVTFITVLALDGAL